MCVAAELRRYAALINNGGCVNTRDSQTTDETRPQQSELTRPEPKSANNSYPTFTHRVLASASIAAASTFSD